MRTEVLEKYKKLSWDFDDTLVGHEMSSSFWDFIIENPYDQVHHIITLRSHGWQDRMFGELLKEGSMLRREHFEHVLNVPDHIYESFHLNSHKRDHPYSLFKGKECQRIGAEVLIDDMEAVGRSQRGCEVYNIPHIHPDEFIPVNVK